MCNKVNTNRRNTAKKIVFLMQNIFILPEKFDFIDTVEPGNIFRTLYF